MILLFIVISSCGSTKRVKERNTTSQDTDDSTIHKQRALLKEAALCKCINEGYGTTRVASDYSLSLYYEQLLYTNSAQARIDSFATAYAGSIRPAVIHEYEGRRAIVYFCMEMYKSRRLDSMVMVLDKEIMK